MTCLPAMAVILIRPALPLWLVVPVAVIFAVAAWTTYSRCSLERRQQFGLWSLRIGALLVLVWLLCQPNSRRVLRNTDPPTIAVAVDVSASMTERLPGIVVGRDERAVEFLSDSRVRRLTRRFRRVQFEIGGDVEESDTPPDRLVFNAPRSLIVSGLNRIAEKLRGANLAAVILLSDGLDQSGQDLSPLARETPIYIPELEKPLPKPTRTAPKTDAWIADVSYPKMTVVNWRTTIDVLVRRRGDAPESFPIHLYQGKQRLRTATISLAKGEHFKSVSFEIDPIQTGRILYRVEIRPARDAKPENNRKEFVIDVTNAKNRVLYLEGTPRWEFKFLKRALLSDKNYQIDAFVQTGSGAFIRFSETAKATQAKTPDLTPAGLSRYRVVILGDLAPATLKPVQWRAIRDFVDKGGGLLLAGGRKAYGDSGWGAAPYIQELLPAKPEKGSRMRDGRFSVDLTPQGRVHPALSALQGEASLPPVLSLWTPVKVGNLSTVLVATLEGAPLVVVRRYGQGRVAMLLSDSLWRWQLGSSSGGIEKSLYGRFVTQLVYWLAPRQKELKKNVLLQVLTARSEVEPRDRVTIGAVYGGGKKKAAALTCTVTTPTGERLPFPMSPALLGEDVGLTKRVEGYKCVFSPARPGKYLITVTTADGAESAKLLLLAHRAERERTGAPLNRALLEKLAKESGGRFLPWKRRYDFLKKIPYHPREIRQIIEKPIWNRFFWLAVLILLFSLEWYWRRRLDLV